MKRFALLILGAALLALPTEAAAQAWRTCTATHLAGTIKGDTTRAQLKPGEVLCYDSTDGTDSAFLAINQCENVDIRFNPDLDGTTFTATVTIEMCAAPSGTVANVCEPSENVILTGDSATGLDGIKGDAGFWLVVNPTNGGATESRIIIKCNGNPEES